jgi:hypothetical protein
LKDDAWVGKVALDEDFSMEHLTQFVSLWCLLQEVELIEDDEDAIVWKLTENGQYSAKSAYDLQFLGSNISPMYKTIWKAWAPPKYKTFAWNTLQNRIWTTERLEKRGWNNCGPCPLCRNATKLVHHLFVHRYATRLWQEIKAWIGIPELQPTQWQDLSIMHWWESITDGLIPNRKAMSSLALVTISELWNECNARVFRNKFAPPYIVLDKIRKEARLWVIAGAKHLGVLVRESSPYLGSCLA